MTSLDSPSNPRRSGPGFNAEPFPSGFVSNTTDGNWGMIPTSSMYPSASQFGTQDNPRPLLIRERREYEGYPSPPPSQYPASLRSSTTDSTYDIGYFPTPPATIYSSSRYFASTTTIQAADSQVDADYAPASVAVATNSHSDSSTSTTLGRDSDPLSSPLTPKSTNNPSAPTKVSLKSWWQSFVSAQRAKKDVDAAPSTVVFGRPLRESLRYASVQISTANAEGELYVWGYIPVVMAKCGLYLKENAREVEGIFQVNGSAKQIRELQAIFDTPPRYGKDLDWHIMKQTCTPHDVASVFKRYLTQLPEPLIPYSLYHEFRNTLVSAARQPSNDDKVIETYTKLIRSMPRANQYLLIYVLDLLSVFARKSDENKMTLTDFAVIFRPGILSHPTHEMSPQEHQLSQRVLEFLIKHQDWFMLDAPPPPQSTEFEADADSAARSDNRASSGSDEVEDDSALSVDGGWNLIARGGRDEDTRRKVSRRRPAASPTTPTRSASRRRSWGA